MHYYIVDGRILDYLQPMDPAFYNYRKLDSEEVEFYLANPGASIQEIDNLEMEQTPPITFQTLKNQKINEIVGAFYTAINSGYYDATLDVTIRIADEDRNQFMQRIGLLGLIPNEMKPATTTITDINGDPHTITLQEFYTLMLYMGLYYDTYVWGKKVSLEAQLKSAQTIEDLNNINW